MSRKRGLRGFECVAEFTNTQLALAQSSDDAQARGIGQSFCERNGCLHISVYTDMLFAQSSPLNLNSPRRSVRFFTCK